MADTSSVARVTEVFAASPESFEAATRLGIERATDTLRNVRSAWVKEMKVDVVEGKITAYRVDLMVTFVLDEPGGLPNANVGSGQQNR